MFWVTILIDTPNGSFLFGTISETEAILLFGIFLIVLTIGIRWFLKRQGQSEDKTKEVVKR